MGWARDGVGYIGNVHLQYWALLHWTGGHISTNVLGILSLKCIGAKGMTIIHTGMGSGGTGWAAYIMPNWAGRMASAIMELITQ